MPIEDKSESQRQYLIYISFSLNNLIYFIHVFFPYPMHNLICRSFFLLPVII